MLITPSSYPTGNQGGGGGGATLSDADADLQARLDNLRRE